MNEFTIRTFFRYSLAIFVVCIFVFPIAWFALTSIKPTSAVFNKDKVVVFDFKPTFENYRVTVLGAEKQSGTGMGTSGGSAAYDGRGSILSSVIIAVSSTFIATVLALLAAYALSRMRC